MYSAYKLNKHGDIILTWYTHFLIWNQPIVPYSIITFGSWPTYRFLRRQIRWCGILITVTVFPQLVVIHTVKGFCLVNKAEVGVFLEFSCFFYDPMDIGNLISASFAFSKSSLNLRNFTVQVLLKTCLENYFGSMWDDCNCLVVEHSLKLPFFGIGMKTTFPVLWPLLWFPNLLAYWLQHYNSIIFKDLK